MKLSEKAVLVRLGISLPGNVRKDKRITADVLKTHSLGINAGRWLKQIFPDEAVEPLKKLEGQGRTFHYEQTLPWSDEGWRILPTANHETYCNKMRELGEEFRENFTSHFLGKMAQWRAWAQDAHNGTFDASLYPPKRECGTFKIDFQPVPCGDDFRTSVSDSEMKIMADQVNSRVENAVSEAKNDLWRRLAAPLGHMADKLKDKDATFRDTLVENIKDMIKLVPALNITGDSEIENFKNEIEEKLAGLTPEVLRENKTVRKQTAQEAAAILKRMQGYFQP